MFGRRAYIEREYERGVCPNDLHKSWIIKMIQCKSLRYEPKLDHLRTTEQFLLAIRNHKIPSHLARGLARLYPSHLARDLARGLAP